MDQSDSPVMRRATRRLTLDSQQDQRLQQEQQKRRQEKRLKKLEKKRRREQAERQAQQSAIEVLINEQQGQQYKDQGNNKLDQQDSDSGIDFERVCEKIKKNYPSQRQKNEPKQKKQKPRSKKRERTPSQSSQQEESESQKTPKKSKKVQKIKKIEKKTQKKKIEEPKIKVKIEQISSKKQSLIQQIAKRWWFALPDWPQIDYNYDNQLEKIGFRCVPIEKFAVEPEIHNGLHKVHCIEGYPGVYKSKFKLVDVRPKDSCPSLQYFMNMQSDKLRKLLKIALQKQIQELINVQFKQSGEKELLARLQKMLDHIK